MGAGASAGGVVTPLLPQAQAATKDQLAAAVIATEKMLNAVVSRPEARGKGAAAKKRRKAGKRKR